MLLEPDKLETIIMAVAHLHNFLRKSMHSVNMYTPPGTFDTETNGELTQGSWRMENQNANTLVSLRNVPRRSTLIAQEIRDEIADYCDMNEGRVPWQKQYA